MELIIESCHALPCNLKVFKINGKDADQDDFGDTYDAENSEIYSCADMRFDPKSSTKEILNKYHITEEEYCSICNELQCKLCVGSCGWCN